nr:hypothetical protein [Tanacetum cinerariifolium]
VQEKETVILKLREKLNSLSGDVKTYKQLFDSIKSSRVQSKEQCDDLINKVNLKSVEVSDLNASLQEKVLVITALKEQLNKLKGKVVLTEDVSLNPIDPALLQVDVAPLVPKLRKNRTTHTDYITHTHEEAATLREIIESERLLSPFNTSLAYAWQFCDSDLEVAFRQHTCFIRNLDGVDLLTGSRGNNLYTLSLQDMLASSPICLFLACAMGKSTKKTHKPKSKDTNQEKLYLLHMDLCGPMRVESVNGKKYILVIVDDYSRFTWVKFLRSKDETLDFIIKFLKMIQNGVVERRNHTLIEVARTMLIYAQATLFLWAEAVATACFTQNQSIIHLRYGKTPYELLHSKLPDLSFFHVFGALCYLTNDSENLAMASEQSSSGPALNDMTPRTISSGLVRTSSSSTYYVPPSRNEWDLLF